MNDNPDAIALLMLYSTPVVNSSLHRRKNCLWLCPMLYYIVYASILLRVNVGWCTIGFTLYLKEKDVFLVWFLYFSVIIYVRLDMGGYVLYKILWRWFLFTYRSVDTLFYAIKHLCNFAFTGMCSEHIERLLLAVWKFHNETKGFYEKILWRNFISLKILQLRGMHGMFELYYSCMIKFFSRLLYHRHYF